MNASPAERLLPPAGDAGTATPAFVRELASLRTACSTVITPADGTAYDAARACWNLDAVGFPALIAQPADADEVAAVVAWAVARGAPLCVASGRHSVWAARTGCLMLDLSRLASIHVDAAARTVECGPGVRLRELDAACAAHRLAVTAGQNPDTGVAGLTLGGGIGFLARRHGLTIDHLIEADVVLASGAAVTASPTQHADLFWALRGGGGNFGVVTRFKFTCRPRGDVLLHVAVHLRASACGLLPGAAAVARRWRDWAMSAPDDAAPVLIVPARRGVLVSLAAWTGDNLDEGRAVLAGNANCGPALVRSCMAVPYGAGANCLQSAAEARGSQRSGRWYTSSVVLGPATDEALGALLAATADGPPRVRAFAVLVRLGGAIARVPADATAFAHRDGAFWMTVEATWTRGGDREHAFAWVRHVVAAMRPWATGTYNTLGAESTSFDAPYGRGGAFARLADVKARYDPTNFFRFNNNIAPAGTLLAAGRASDGGLA